MPAEVTTTGRATDHPKIEILTERITTPLEAIFRDLDLPDPNVSVLLTDDDEIQQLNDQWRDLDEPTDVLSFPAYGPDDLPDDPRHLGDIAISVECAERLVASGDHRRRVAEELDMKAHFLDWTLADEVSFLFVHGLLHLVGYDHGAPDEERIMRSQERRLWQLTTD